ncbi:MAG: aminotransferase class V-fold PLP-dependent enzyme [Gemmatimonadaceae bacterium]
MLKGPSAAVSPTSGRGPISSLRAAEYSRLDRADHAYLDYTGAALHPESLVRAHARSLRRSVLGNPHADSRASRASTRRIEAARRRVREFFDADPAEYAVVFTANASGALRLVGEAYPFGPRAPFVLAADNHNSVNGIAELARRAGAAVVRLPIDTSLELDAPERRLAAIPSGEGGLFAYPAQSNFSGVRHPLALVRAAQAMGYRVLLDAASFVPSHGLSLRDVPADFVCVSFYKMFGYPTGIGALIARRDALAELRRPWFAGGTVDFVSTQHQMHRFAAGEAAFEDGTANFLAAEAVRAGLDFLDEVGVDRVGAHACRLAALLRAGLRALRHASGEPVVRVYGPPGADTAETACDLGATVSFNVLRADGVAIPFGRVERAARRAGVSVRGGCFCNPGASEAAFGLPPERTLGCLQAMAEGEWSVDRFARCLEGVAVGAVRASLGMSSNERDVERLLAVVAGVARRAEAGPSGSRGDAGDADGNSILTG